MQQVNTVDSFMIDPDSNGPGGGGPKLAFTRTVTQTTHTFQATAHGAQTPHMGAQQQQQQQQQHARHNGMAMGRQLPPEPVRQPSLLNSVLSSYIPAYMG